MFLATGLKYWGIGAAIQGGCLIPLSFAGLGTAARVAEILRAEDFDRLGGEPIWFGPWSLAVQHAKISMGILSVVGMAVFLAGVMCVRGVKGSIRWLECACWVALVSCCLFVAALLPLWAAGGGWPAGTPADHLRRVLSLVMVAGGLELFGLLGTAIIMHKARTEGHRVASSSEA